MLLVLVGFLVVYQFLPVVARRFPTALVLVSVFLPRLCQVEWLLLSLVAFALVLCSERCLP